MSFAGDIKAELAHFQSKSRHCCIAELLAVIAFAGEVCGGGVCGSAGEVRVSGGKVRGSAGEERGSAGEVRGSAGEVCGGEEAALRIATENNGLARKFLMLVKQLFGYEVSLGIVGGKTGRQRSYLVQVRGEEQVKKVLQAVHIMDEKGRMVPKEEWINGLVVQKSCCRRAFIRGAFLSAGSMSNPGKSYHFEIVCPFLKYASKLQGMINSFGLDAKIVERKNHYVVYLKEGSQIVDVLNVMEAHKALLDLENVRILKNMRNQVNRQVNCETANINKIVNAAVRQTEDIAFIQKEIGIEKLPPNLQEAAKARLEYPEASLEELGSYLTPPVGKSGMNHRLRKISEIAEDIKERRRT